MADEQGKKIFSNADAEFFHFDRADEEREAVLRRYAVGRAR